MNLLDFNQDDLKTGIEKAFLKKKITRAVVFEKEGVPVVALKYFNGKNWVDYPDQRIGNFLSTILYANVGFAEKISIKGALALNTGGVSTQVKEAVAMLENLLIKDGNMPYLIERDGKIYDRDKIEVVLSGFFEEAKKYLPTNIVDRVGEEE